MRRPVDPTPAASLPMLFAALALACASAPSPLAPPLQEPESGSPLAPDEAGSLTVPLRFGDPAALAYDRAIFPGARYLPQVTPPAQILGQPVGSRLARHAEIVECFERWAEESPRISVARFGTTFEGRPLLRAVITTEENHGRLDQILDDLGRLADPGGLSSEAGDAIAAASPAVAWLGYSIHGDEPSGTDASLALGYHLIADDSSETLELLGDVVVVIDPCQNPDGRTRILRMIEESAGARANLDYASAQRGRWPWGRGNHYLFDMNRDWLAATQPETRARWREVQKFHPQLFVDIHEMGPLDTFLFSPAREPINAHQPEANKVWNQVFGADQAAAFDRYGWSYYTREWSENWYPGYSDSWGGLHGAIGILHEQARTLGAPLVRASGEVLTYRETVHHQVVGSMANLRSLADNREAVLRTFVEQKRLNLSPDHAPNQRMFALRPGAHPDRERRLIEVLAAQGIEVRVAAEPFRVTEARSALGESHPELEHPPGTLFVPPLQANSNVVHALLELDPRFSDAELLKERTELEQKNRSRIYDVTAWSLAHAYDLDAFWSSVAAPDSEPFDGQPSPSGIVETRDGSPAYGWIVDGQRDAAVVFAAHALESGLAVHVADEPFGSTGRRFARGSLLVRRHENEVSVEAAGAGPLPALEARERVRLSAEYAGVIAYATGSGRAPDDGPDLGGGHFHLLSRPRVALLSNSPVSPSSYGHLWYQLDQVLGVPVSQLDAQSFGRYDLRRYNVLVAPPGAGPVLREHADRLASWVDGGGTLIACGNAAAAIAAEGPGLSDVRLRRDSLERLEEFDFAADRERAARDVQVDPAAVWDGAPAQDDGESDPQLESSNGSPAPAGDPDAEREDAWRRRFSPVGVYLRATVDENSWLTFGARGDLPVFTAGSHVYLSAPPVRTAVRFGPRQGLRLGGLLWPEARERIANSAWGTIESVGDGQVILFASTPGFRGMQRTTARFFANAVVYGPGVGATQPVGW